MSDRDADKKAIEDVQQQHKELLRRNNQMAKDMRALSTEMYRTRMALKNLAEEVLLAERRKDPGYILRAAAQIYSQNYEDAIIAEIFSRIGVKSRTFIEIGVETGVECNTRLLLDQGWRGVWIEGSPEHAATARTNMKVHVDSGALTIIEAMVDRDNVQTLVGDALGGASIDFLSIDIDYNTSHIWRALNLPARVACLEYNSSVPPTMDWEVPYDPQGAWDGTNFMGASLKTLELIGREKRMALVGCDVSGVNAFFVEEALCGDKFSPPFTAERHFEPLRWGFHAHWGGKARQQAVKLR